jgi:hypothetical protein
LTGEALGRGGRVTHWWRGGARRSRKRGSSAGEAWDGGCSGTRSGGRHESFGRDGGGRGVRAGGVGLNAQVGGRRGVGWAGGMRIVRRAV